MTTQATQVPTLDVRFRLEGNVYTLTPKKMPELAIGDTVRFHTQGGKFQLTIPGPSPFQKTGAHDTQIQDMQIMEIVRWPSPTGKFSFKCGLNINSNAYPIDGRQPQVIGGEVVVKKPGKGGD